MPLFQVGLLCAFIKFVIVVHLSHRNLNAVASRASSNLKANPSVFFQPCKCQRLWPG
jgi:hypothetical protein